MFLDHKFWFCNNDIPSSEHGNETKWGCVAALTQYDCNATDSWCSQCCDWSGNTCVSNEDGKAQNHSLIEIFLFHLRCYVKSMNGI